MSSPDQEPTRTEVISFYGRKTLGLPEGTQLQCGDLLEKCLETKEKNCGLIVHGTPAGHIGCMAAGGVCHVFFTNLVPGTDQTFRLRLEPCVVFGDIPREVYVDIVRGQDFATVVYPFGYNINEARTRNF